MSTFFVDRCFRQAAGNRVLLLQNNQTQAVLCSNVKPSRIVSSRKGEDICSIFWNIMPCSLFQIDQRFGGKLTIRALFKNLASIL
jgi:hypothetical protein